MKKTALLGVSLFAFLILATPGAAYDRYQMDFEVGQPKVVIVTDALGKGTPFMYVTFKVTNNTGKERVLSLSILARSDTKKRIEGEDRKVEVRAGFDARAMKAILKKERKKKLLSMAGVQGTIKPGETKEAVAIFPQPDPEMDRMELRVYGLVDPIDVVDGKRFHEVKVLSLHYVRPGDEFGHTGDAIKFSKKKWVIEGERKELPAVE